LTSLGAAGASTAATNVAIDLFVLYFKVGEEPVWIEPVLKAAGAVGQPWKERGGENETVSLCATQMLGIAVFRRCVAAMLCEQSRHTIRGGREVTDKPQ
jgi:hypothetical protein